MEQSPRKPWWRRWFGTRSESAAAKFLKGLGYRILLRNYRCPHGEIDLIALDGRCIVFVEVRSTGGDDPAVPAESVNEKKQVRLTNLALAFLKAKRLLDRPARFDVLAISWPAGRREPLIEHHPHAFEALERPSRFS